MSSGDAFDPYRIWLGIPAEEQPPNHYRLLAIPLFESDLDVISNARDARMAHVKNYQTGKRAALSQRLLNELSAASICLLSPDKKSQYDAQLRKELVKSQPPSPSEAPRPVSAAAPDAVDLGLSLSTASVRRARKAPAGPKPLVIPGAAIAVLALAVLGVLWYLWSRPHDAPEQTREIASAKTAQTPAPEPKSPSKPVAEPPDKGRAEKRPPAASKPPKETLPISPPSPDNMQPPDQPAERPAEQPIEKPVVKPEPEPEPQAKPEPEPAEKEPVKPAAPKKASKPDDAALATARKRILDTFKKELAAESSQEKTATAEKLRKLADESADDLPARWVLFGMAAEEFLAAGKLAESMGAIDQMGECFQTQPVALKLWLIDGLLKANRPGKKLAIAPDELLLILTANVDAAVEADDYAMAKKALDLALTAGRLTNDPSSKTDLLRRKRELESATTEYEGIARAKSLLEKTPDDAAANQRVGLWYGRTKGDWKAAMPFLAKGGDAKWADLARRDLANPRDPVEQETLGDDWWNVAEKEKGPAKANVASRAMHWYDQAMPKMLAVNKAKVEKRRASIEQLAAPPDGVQAAIKPGNVALATNGTKVTGVIKNAAALLDGDSKQYNDGVGFAAAKCPTDWTIEFDKVYRIQQINFLLWDKDARVYRYQILTSPDGKKFVPLVDNSQKDCRSWQQLKVSPPRPVKAVKLIGRYNSVPGNGEFHVVEFEAYCTPPK